MEESEQFSSCLLCLPTQLRRSFWRSRHVKLEVYFSQFEAPRVYYIRPMLYCRFGIITMYTVGLLCEAYRTGDEYTGQRNPTYMQAVKSHLGKTFLARLPEH